MRSSEIVEAEPTRHIDSPMPTSSVGPTVDVENRSARRDWLDGLIRLLTALVLAGVVAIIGLMLLVLVSFTGMAARIGDAGSQIGVITAQASSALERLAQMTGDLTDPAHPPRIALYQDTEFDALDIAGFGETIGQTEEYRLTLATIAKRAGASNANEAQYASIQREYLTPRERRVLGVVVDVDRGEATYYLYKGESFRIGHTYYKVNWVSVDRNAVAIARYRSPDLVTAPLKFEVD